MKKIALIVSAISAALFASATAKADVSVTGSAAVGISSGNSTTGTRVYNGGAVAFALSSDLGNGVVASTSAGITLDSNDAGTLGTRAVSGLSNISFATGGATITIGGDVDIAGDGVGEVGGVAGDLVDEGGNNTGILGMGGLTDEDGYGISVSTAIGTGTLTASYILDTGGTETDNRNYSKTDDADTATGMQFSIPMGALSATVGFASDDTRSETVTGGTLAYTADFGSVTAGMADKNGNTDTSTWGIAYSGTLGSASVKLGYTNGTSGSNKSTRTEASISQSIGAGASIYFDVQQASGAGVTSDGTNIAVGTTFSF
jgi:hypothetical protein